MKQLLLNAPYRAMQAVSSRCDVIADIFPDIITGILIRNANGLCSSPSSRFCHFRERRCVSLRCGGKCPRPHGRKEVQLGLGSRSEPCSFHMPFRSGNPAAPGFGRYPPPPLPYSLTLKVREGRGGWLPPDWPVPSGASVSCQPSRDMMP